MRVSTQTLFTFVLVDTSVSCGVMAEREKRSGAYFRSLTHEHQNLDAEMAVMNSNFRKYRPCAFCSRDRLGRVHVHIEPPRSWSRRPRSWSRLGFASPSVLFSTPPVLVSTWSGFPLGLGLDSPSVLVLNWTRFTNNLIWTWTRPWRSRLQPYLPELTCIVKPFLRPTRHSILGENKTLEKIKFSRWRTGSHQGEVTLMVVSREWL